MINAKSTHDEDVKYYRGSSKEEADVIKYYNICRGDWDKVVECITFGDRSDIERWKSDIIKPALIRGAVRDFSSSNSAAAAAASATNTKSVVLGDSSSSDEDGEGHHGHHNNKADADNVSNQSKDDD